MPKNDNAHALRLYNALSKYMGDETADRLARLYPLGKSADAVKKARWAVDACRFLEENCPHELIPPIREQCFCTDGAAAAKLMRSCLKKSDSIRTFVRLFNQNDSSGGWLEYISERELLLCYPTCFCACVKHSPTPAPRTWCLCSVGYAKRLFSQVFDSEISASLVSSLKTGGERCAIHVSW